jgi:hypothetical protein
MNKLIAVCFLVCWGVSSSWSGQSVLSPSADASLFEYTPDFNSGQSSLVAGRTQQSPGRARALMKFPVASAIPSNAVVTSVQLKLYVSKEASAGGVLSVFDLTRMLKDWGEGIQSGGGGGGPASTNELTWNSSFHGVSLWQVPGAVGVTDSILVSSASTPLTNGQLNFASSPGSVADVKLWIQQPGTNFGWMLRSQDETTPRTAHRFYSRESPLSYPELTVNWLIPTRIEISLVASNQINLGFVAYSNQSHRVEYTTNLPATVWQTFSNFAAVSTNRAVELTVPRTNIQSYFRVVAE